MLTTIQYFVHVSITAEIRTRSLEGPNRQYLEVELSNRIISVKMIPNTNKLPNTCFQSHIDCFPLSSV